MNIIPRNLTVSKLSSFCMHIVCFGPIEKTKMTALDLLIPDFFSIFVSNCWMEWEDIWQESRLLCTCSWSSVCSSSLSENQDGKPGLWFGETYLTSSTARRDETWKKSINRHSLPGLVLFEQIEKPRWPPRLLIMFDICTFPLQLLNGIQRTSSGRNSSPSSTLYYADWKIKITIPVYD